MSLLDTYFEPLVYGDSKEVLELAAEISELSVEDQKLLEHNCAEEESYLLKHVLPYVSIALENCYTLNPDDPLDFICRYLTEKGKQIEKAKAEERTRKYNRQLFESNQLESAKVHLSIMLSQLNEKFVRSEEGSSNEVNESKDHKK